MRRQSSMFYSNIIEQTLRISLFTPLLVTFSLHHHHHHHHQNKEFHFRQRFLKRIELLLLWLEQVEDRSLFAHYKQLRKQIEMLLFMPLRKIQMLLPPWPHCITPWIGEVESISWKLICECISPCITVILFCRNYLDLSPTMNYLQNAWLEPRDFYWMEVCLSHGIPRVIWLAVWVPAFTTMYFSYVPSHP